MSDFAWGLIVGAGCGMVAGVATVYIAGAINFVRRLP
jgi:hypothetical protein